MESTSRDRSTYYAVGVLVVLLVVHLWLRIGSLPGPWGADALRYLEVALGAEGAGDDPRTRRRVVLGLVELGLALFGRSPSAASVPGILASALVLPLTWLALRRSVGPWYALAPALVWTFLGVDIEETREISADALLAPFGAAVAWALSALEGARERDPSRLGAAVGLGLALGLGFLVKETFVFVVVGAAVASLVLRPGWRPLLIAGGLALVLALVGEATLGPRLGNASADMARVDAPVALDDPAFLRRLTIDVPLLLLTADLAFGRVFLLLLPLLCLLPLRALRGAPIAVAASVSVLAFMWMPVSLDRWVVLPAHHARYLMGALPLLLVALTRALRSTGAWRGDSVLLVLGVLLALPFLVGMGWAGVCVGLGLASLVVPRVLGGAHVEARLTAGHLVALAALLAALPHVGAGVSCLAVALTLGLACVRYQRRGRRLRLGLSIGIVAIVGVMQIDLRFVPDRTWNVHEIGSTGVPIAADPIAARRIHLGALLAGSDTPVELITVSSPEQLQELRGSIRFLVLRNVVADKPPWFVEPPYAPVPTQDLGDSRMYRISRVR